MSDVAAIQIRAGDVIDRSPHSVDAMLESQHNFSWSCHRSVRKVGTPLGSRGWCTPAMHIMSGMNYVPPLAHWKYARELIVMRNISRVSIIAASHYNLSDRFAAPNYRKSCEYIKRVGSFFASANLSVRYRIGRSPDDDIRFMSHARVVATSGGSFARYASRASELQGAEVVRFDGSDAKS